MALKRMKFHSDEDVVKKRGKYTPKSTTRSNNNAHRIYGEIFGRMWVRKYRLHSLPDTRVELNTLQILVFYLQATKRRILGKN